VLACDTLVRTTPKDRAESGRFLPTRPVLAGDVFARWTVVEPYAGGRLAFCRCACGAERLVSRNNLLSGRSGGCRACKGVRQRVRRDVTGEVCGTWRIVCDDEPSMKAWRQVTAECLRCGAESSKSLRWLRYKGGLRCAACDRPAVTYQGVQKRLARGWTSEEARTLPARTVPARLISAGV